MKDFTAYPRIIIPGQEVTLTITMPEGIQVEEEDTVSAKAGRFDPDQVGGGLPVNDSVRFVENTIEIVIPSQETAKMVSDTDYIAIHLSIYNHRSRMAVDPYIYIGGSRHVVGTKPKPANIRVAFGLLDRHIIGLVSPAAVKNE